MILRTYFPVKATNSLCTHEGSNVPPDILRYLGGKWSAASSLIPTFLWWLFQWALWRAAVTGLPPWIQIFSYKLCPCFSKKFGNYTHKYIVLRTFLCYGNILPCSCQISSLISISSIHNNPTLPSAQQAAFSVVDETWHG